MYVPSARDDWQCCFYEFHASITYNGKTDQLKEGQILSVLLEKDYDTVHTPILIIDLSLDYYIDEFIKKDPNATLQLRVDKCIGIEENKQINITNRSLYINSVFSFIIRDTTPVSTQYNKEINNVNEHREGDYMLVDTKQSVRYILVQKEDLMASKNIVNCVISSATMTQAVHMLLSHAGCNEVLMANFDNAVEYKELYIPPLPLMECLLYLKNRYGFHKEDTTIFMDFDTMYIVRKSALCTVFRRRETKNICICLNSPESVYGQCSGVIYSGNMTYLNVGCDQFYRDDAGTISDQTVGTDFLIFNDNELGYDKVEIENKRALGNNNTTVRTVKGYNAFIADQLKYRKAEEQNVFKIVCTGIDLSVLTPNKQYSIVSNSTEIALDAGGKYRLSRQVTKFVRTGNLMIPMTTLTVKKTME